MTAIKLSAFGGMLPSWNDLLLPDGQSSFCRDAYLFSGALTGWRQPKLLRQLNNSAAQYVYRIPNKITNNTAILATDSKWLEFNDPDTTVMRSPVVQDQYDRHYAASPSQPPKYNTYDRILADEHWWLLGVPASGCAPGVTITGGGDTSQVGFTTVMPDSTGPAYLPGNAIMLVSIVPNGSMLIQDVSFVPQSTNVAANFQGVVYGDLNGVPYGLLAVGDAMVGITAGVNAVATFTNGVSVISDTTYWIGIACDSAMYVSVVDSLNQGKQFSNTYSNGPSNPAPAPTAAPTWQMWADLLGASVYTARAYVYTWVTAYGEEGPPSLPTVVNGWSNGTWQLDLFQPTPNNMGADYDPGTGVKVPADRNITTTRIYRSITNQTGQGTYFWVADIPVTQGTYEDTADDATIALNQQLVSLYWSAPPADLQAIMAFPNGIAVGFRSNEVWFSEAYRPHAWPPGYVLTTEYPVVSIGVSGQAIVVATQGTPYLINGINPAAMALTKLNLPEPCIHRGSLVSTDTTVLYISQNGLIQISQSGQGSNITEGWISREKWQSLTPQKQVRAVKNMTSYFAFGSDTDQAPLQSGYTVELSQEDQTGFTVWPVPGGHRIGFSELSLPNGFEIQNVLLDPWTGVCLLVQNNAVYFYDFSDQSPTIIPFLWRSKLYQNLSKKNFAACRIWFTVPPNTPSQVARNTDDPQPTLSPNQYGIVRFLVDNGQLWTTRELRTSGELLRIYSGSKWEYIQVEIEGRVTIPVAQLATSVKELGSI
jgi:hypothetical protein